jgi:hypothetical protein
MTDGSTSGTLLYMAPELMAGQTPTVQADIYALGVVLFQLVVGNLNRAMGPGWERDVDDELLREDIAALVDASPERRLADAAEVARRLRSLPDRRQRREAERSEREELERARAALARAVHRRRITLAVGTGLVLFAAAMTIQARRIAAEARRANREAATAREVSRFLVEVPVADRDRGAARR